MVDILAGTILRPDPTTVAALVAALALTVTADTMTVDTMTAATTVEHTSDPTATVAA